MKVRFQADADLNQIIIKAVLRIEPRIDFLIAQMANLAGVNALTVLGIAATSGRVLVTHDRKTMPKYFTQFITTKTSAGLLVIPQNLPIRQAADDLILIWHASEAEEWVNRLYSLPL